jgi:hypothetical protein
MAQALARVGLLGQGGSADAPVQTEYLWPCNVKHWHQWQELRTQWRVGMSGATGLDYASAIAHLRTAHSLRGKQLQKAWAAMRACEDGTLQAWAEAAEQKRNATPSTPPKQPAP